MREVSVAVVYHSVTGTTGQLAKAIASGIESTSTVQALLLPISGADIQEGRYTNTELIEKAGHSAGIIFGSPTFMGSVTAQFKSFADATSDIWERNAWAGKVAAGFTIGSNLSGDQLHTIQYLSILASQHGMLWTSLSRPTEEYQQDINRLGAQSGLIAHSEDGTVLDLDLKTAAYLGARVAKFSKVIKLSGKII